MSVSRTRDFLRRAFFENAAYKLVALLLSVTLFIVVHGDRNMVISFYLPVAYTEPGDRVMVGKPVDSVRVTVEGPWTRIRKFDERQVEPLQVDLSRLSDGDYQFSPDRIQLPPGLEVVAINPPSIRLMFEERAEKIVAVRPVLDGDPALGFRVERIEAEPAYVKVRGPKGAIEVMTEVKTRPISIAGKEQSVDEKVALAPAETQVEIVDQPMIRVRVRIEEQSAERVIAKLPITLRPGGQLTQAQLAGVTVVPGEVRVRLRGPARALAGLDAKAVSVYVLVHADDLGPEPTPARVLVDGEPPGVAVELDPRVVRLIGPGKKR